MSILPVHIHVHVHVPVHVYVHVHVYGYAHLHVYVHIHVHVYDPVLSYQGPSERVQACIATLCEVGYTRSATFNRLFVRLHNTNPHLESCPVVTNPTLIVLSIVTSMVTLATCSVDLTSNLADKCR